jgi:LPS-assembly protein
VKRGDVPTDRYRLTLQDTTSFGHDIYGIVNVTKLSDPFIMQDFYQTEFRTDPVPDNVISLAKTDPSYTLTTLVRFQMNDFFEQTERLPEVVLDIKRQPLFGTPVFYEGESGFADLHRSFAEGSGFESYGTTRLDTFHQILYPNTYFGWLSVVPRAGFRATYYDKTRDLGNTVFSNLDDPLIPNFIPQDPTPTNPVIDAGSGVRTVADAGVEASFKLSRSWEDVANRTMGLDGLLHVIQPYTNFSYVHENGINPAAVLEFDRFEPSTQLRPLDFPQFTSIDSIASWTVWRNGIRNRLETRRDDVTVTWLELDTFFDVNFDNPYDRRDYSNFFNKLRFTPLPWASLSIDSQIPVFSSGFTEVNTTLAIQPVANLQLSAGHRYLNDNPFFEHSSLFVVGGYYRVTDNWGFGFQEQYEGTVGVFQEQRYAIYRDLTNWVASFGAVVRDNTGNKKEYGVLLTFSLKAFPRFGFDLNFDPGSYGQ